MPKKEKFFLESFKDRRTLKKKSVQTKFTHSLNVIKPQEKIGDKKTVQKEKFKVF